MKKSILFISLTLMLSVVHAQDKLTKDNENTIIRNTINIPNMVIEDKGYPKNPYAKKVTPKAVDVARQAQKDANLAVIEVIDNSIPGQWNVESVTLVHNINERVLNGKREKLFNEDYCVSKEEIEASKNKKLIEKLGLNKMNCNTKYNNISKNEAKFTLICTKEITEDKFSSSVNVIGSIISLPKNNKMLLDYEIKSTKDGKVADYSKFTIQSNSKYIGVCPVMKK